MLNYIFLILILLILFTIIIIVNIFKKNQMASYLNYNSTAFIGGNKKFNTSDVAYDEVQKIKEEESDVRQFIKDIVHASEDTRVIFNSGATESIATLFNWVKSFNNYGCICGSNFDHDSIQFNSNNQNLNYKKINVKHILRNQETLDPNCSCILLTHVSPFTGEILPIEEFLNKTDQVALEEVNDDNDELVEVQSQYKPIIALDVTQSIGKTPIYMEKWGVNFLFFSLHKLGGELNTGVMLVRDTFDKPFKPLIAGRQQDGLRGGTYNSYAYLNFKELYKNYTNEFDIDSCKKEWNKVTKKLELEGLNVVKPKFNHLFNTISIKTNNCSYPMINELSKFGIYVSGRTACDEISSQERNELDLIEENLEGGSSKSNNSSTIRISFIGDVISDKTINKIIEVINKYEHEDD